MLCVVSKRAEEYRSLRLNPSVSCLQIIPDNHAIDEAPMNHRYTLQPGSILCSLLLAVLLLPFGLSSTIAQIFPAPGSGPADQGIGQMNQTRLLGGITVAGNYNGYSRGIPMVYTPICNHLDAGEGFGYGVGLNASYLLGPDLRLTGHLRYASHPGSFEIFQMLGRAWTKDGDEMGHVTIRIASEVDYRALESDLMLMWSVGRFSQDRATLGLGIGPWVAWRLRATMSQEHDMEIYSSDGEFLTERDVSFFGGEDVVRTTLADDLEMTRARELQYGVRLGSSVEYHLGRGLYLTPGLFVDIAATSMTDFNWGELTTWSLQTDLSIGL